MLHNELPIHKRGCELLALAMHVQKEMPRAFKRQLGEKIAQHCTDMLDLMAMANASGGHQRAAFIEQLLQRQRAATVLLRVAMDMRMVSPKLWASAVQLLDSIGKQGGGWLKSSQSKAPAA